MRRSVLFVDISPRAAERSCFGDKGLRDFCQGPKVDILPVSLQNRLDRRGAGKHDPTE